MKDVLFFAMCIALALVLSVILVEHERSRKFYECLRSGVSVEACRSML